MTGSLACLAESLRSFLGKSGERKEESGKQKEERGKRKEAKGKRKEEAGKSPKCHKVSV